MIIRFGPFALDPDKQELSNLYDQVDLEPQVFALLTFLAQNADRVVSKDEIIEYVWDGRIVSDANLNSRINAARKAVGDDGTAQAIIRTYPRRGFRFVADIKSNEPPAKSAQVYNGRSRVLVLPFSNQSSDPEMDYLAAAMTEDMIAALSRSKQFTLTPFASVIGFRDAIVDVPLLWREQGIRYVIEGSIRRMGKKLQISVLLNNAEQGDVHWSEKYVHDDGDLFAVGEDVTSRVASAVEPTMRQSDRKRAVGTENPSAWECYLRGTALMVDVPVANREENAPLAIEELRRALELDPYLSEAHSGMARALWFSVAWSFSDDRQTVSQEALSYAHKAVVLDARNAESLGILGMIQAHLYMLPEGISALRRAVVLDPNKMHHKIWLGLALLSSGNLDAAVREFEIVQDAGKLESTIGTAWAWLAMCRVFEGRYAEAEPLARDAVDNFFTKYWADVALILALVHLGKHDEAKAACKTVQTQWPGMTCQGLLSTSLLADPEKVALIIDGMRTAGLPE